MSTLRTALPSTWVDIIAADTQTDDNNALLLDAPIDSPVGADCVKLARATDRLINKLLDVDLNAGALRASAARQMRVWMYS